jgi:hypothetical protein
VKSAGSIASGALLKRQLLEQEIEDQGISWSCVCFIVCIIPYIYMCVAHTCTFIHTRTDTHMLAHTYALHAFTLSVYLVGPTFMCVSRTSLQ